MLILVAAIALAIVSLKYASSGWMAVVGLLTMVAALAAVLAAIFDRAARTFAIGFSVAVLAYAILILTGGTVEESGISTYREFYMSQARLPTSLLLRYVHKPFEHYTYVRWGTEEVLPDDVATKMLNDWQTNVGAATTGIGIPPVVSQQRPLAEYFMPIGHYWWALLLGYLGGCLAQHFARRGAVALSAVRKD
jgi:hypothetical protein